MASALMQGMSAPSGGSSLLDAPSIASQVAGETEEERKRRIQAMQNAKQLPGGMNSLAAGYGSALTMS
jgi:hypothetical protein